ncbi:MAG: hypothetical protein WAV98_01650 [Minisyncoccia bacterium]
MPQQQKNESAVSPELAETVARLKEAGYLDTSFEGKGVHELTMRPLSKEEALAEYRTSGGKTYIWDDLEKNMPYATPSPEKLDVMIIDFGKTIGSDEALAEMDALGVRPLTYEELIQYGIANPSHQKQDLFIGLGTKHTLVGSPRTPVIGYDSRGRVLGANHWVDNWGAGNCCYFPVVRK